MVQSSVHSAVQSLQSHCIESVESSDFMHKKLLSKQFKKPDPPRHHHTKHQVAKKYYTPKEKDIPTPSSQYGLPRTRGDISMGGTDHQDPSPEHSDRLRSSAPQRGENNVTAERKRPTRDLDT